MAGRLDHLRISFQPLELIILSIILSVASFERFYQLEEKLVFSTDQGRALLAARNILQGHLTLVGPETSLTGFHLGPFYYYLTAIPLWLGHWEPLGPALLTASFGVATVFLLYWYVKRSWGIASGLVSALAYALSPQAIWQSRIAIEPSPLPFFSVLWLIFTTLWLEQKKDRWLGLSLLTIFLAVQLNFSAISLLGATTFFVWWEKLPKISPLWKQRAVIGALCAVLGLALGHGFARGITSLGYFWRIWQQLTFPSSSVLALFWFVIFELTVWKLFLAWKKQSLTPTDKALSLWFLTALLGFLIKHVSGEHSLALLFPVPALVLGIGFVKLQTYTRNAYLWASIPVLLLLMGFQSARFLESRQPVSIHDHQKVVEKIIELSQGQPYEFIYRGHLDVYDAADDHYQYLLWKAGRQPSASSRINTSRQYTEKWLLPTSKTPKMRIYLYSSLTEAQRYKDLGPFVEVGQVALRSENITEL